MRNSTAGRIVAAIAISLILPEGRGEGLNEAWDQAIRVNGLVGARQIDSLAAGTSLGAARAARLPTMSVSAINSFLSQSPTTRIPASITGTGTAAASSRSGFPVLGPNQTDIPFVFANISQPIYQGGRIRGNIEASTAVVKYQMTEEFRTVLDLKLTVAEAYVGVLRAKKNLDVSLSNVAQLSAFLRDVTNRKDQGRATLNEELAAEVSLANAKLQEVSARKNLEVAWATYNRYLYRPIGTVVDIQEIAGVPPSSASDELKAHSLNEAASSITVDEARAADLTGRALQGRPELRGLSEQAKQSEALANVSKAAIKPQFSFNASYIDIGSQNFTNPNIFAGTFQLSWTLFDGGQTRRRAETQRLQARSYLKQRADASAEITLQIRSRMLDVDESRQRVIISGASVASAEENIKVVTERYQQGLSIYTEVLDAESRRIQSLNGYYGSVYDNAIAVFRLHRAVGDL
jgi:outer membrane protein